MRWQQFHGFNTMGQRDRTGIIHGYFEIAVEHERSQ